MIIRKNTKAFKTIVEIVRACEARNDRAKLIRLYITKAGHTIRDRINVEGIQGETDVFYDLNYAAVLANLGSSNHLLHQSDEVPGIYFFHTSSNKTWDENPFEFDERISDEFASLADLPATRKREKPVKVESLPKQKAISRKSEAASKQKPGKKPEPARKKDSRKQESAPRQPHYKLTKKIHFTDLDKIVVRQADLTKQGVLDYYYKMADHVVPYLKDRPQVIRLHTARGPNDYPDTQALEQDALVELPDWIQTAATGEAKQKRHLLLCNNKEHLLFYTEKGCIDFYPSHARAKSPDMPDYALIGLTAASTAFGKVIDTALTAHSILTGLQLPSFVKTDGLAGLHIYIPLDAKSEFVDSRRMAERICRLIRLKMPDAVALKDAEESAYGNVVLDYQLNDAGQSVVAPYALLPGSATVATPLFWEEVTSDLQIDQLNHQTVPRRLKDTGDPFEGLFKKRVNATAVAENLDTHYSFLF